MLSHLVLLWCCSFLLSKGRSNSAWVLPRLFSCMHTHLSEAWKKSVQESDPDLHSLPWAFFFGMESPIFSTDRQMKHGRSLQCLRNIRTQTEKIQIHISWPSQLFGFLLVDIRGEAIAKAARMLDLKGAECRCEGMVGRKQGWRRSSRGEQNKGLGNFCKDSKRDGVEQSLLWAVGTEEELRAYRVTKWSREEQRMHGGCTKENVSAQTQVF